MKPETCPCCGKAECEALDRMRKQIVKRRQHLHVCEKDGFRLTCMTYGCGLEHRITHAEHLRIIE